MTQKQFLEAVLTADVADELKEYATDRLEKLAAQREKANAKAAEKRAEKANTEYEPIRTAIFEVLTETPKTAPQLIAEAELDVTAHKVSYAMRELIDNGTVVKKQITVNGKGKHIAYALA